jgi:hypothetical protein
MANERTRATGQDAFLINMNDHCEVEYWAKKFRVSEERLAQEVMNVGNSAEAVEKSIEG